ncbi:Predicted dehydrogenase [Catalinimonas alkaloidigena]|uniref:Predicted dehydrogenase n=1 Tax=Catalinimonas alkaloidigena TaxID=1075417 RepID=A0A1G8ZJ83_9BACT|nr:Gfo/Idh/MocA family oxidoreductase [Catalinimonas alkaloidigena]SDK15088.1 Predicted dehydrogenase [Catalinimonas alkaloidigena]
MSEQNIRFAVVGCGHIGKRHAAMIQQHPEAELVGVIDIDPQQQAYVESTFRVPFFPSLEVFLHDGPAAEVLNICTPNFEHAPQAIQALEADCHVVVEKPMALSKADGEAIIFKALQRSRAVFCVMQNRYSPPSVWLKELVDSGRLGKIYFVEVNCYWNRDGRYYKPGGWKGVAHKDGGTLFTQFSHFIDTMYWLFGDIKTIQGRFYDFNHQQLTEFEDSGVVSFDFVKGGAGTLTYSTAVWDRNLESSLTILAEHGSVKVGGQYMNRVEHCHIRDYKMPTLPEAGPPNVYEGYTGSAANHHYVIQNVVDTLRNRSFASTNALEGLKVIEMIERIYALK